MPLGLIHDTKFPILFGEIIIYSQYSIQYMNSMPFSFFPLRKMKYHDDNNSHNFREIPKNKKPQNYHDNVAIGSE